MLLDLHVEYQGPVQSQSGPQQEEQLPHSEEPFVFKPHPLPHTIEVTVHESLIERRDSHVLKETLPFEMCETFTFSS